MQPFRHYLRAFIDRRFPSDADFARAIGIGAPFVSLVLSGRKAPSLKTIDQWVAALELSDPERTVFLLAASIANSPPAVPAYLQTMEDEVAGLRSDLAKMEAKISKVHSRRRRRPAARPPSR